ncbi:MULTISPECIES: hypothetical protein [Nocardioides]|uniref:hypothetical protein n=1 Tax=Nocardioides TaxID=1839 RepID=UPI000C78A2DD|nr:MULTISPECIES: hypothetical protein [Nocardioides]
MGRMVGVGLGVVMLVVGAVWTFQGLGWWGGSSMSGVDFWAKLGPAVAGLGVALIIVAARGPRT